MHIYTHVCTVHTCIYACILYILVMCSIARVICWVSLSEDKGIVPGMHKPCDALSVHFVIQSHTTAFHIHD